MKKIIALLLGLMLALMLAAPAQSVRPSTGGNTLTYIQYSRFIDPIIEQQSDIPFWSGDMVFNPFAPNCAWDVDDDGYSIAEGTLKAGQTLTKTECVISSAGSYYLSINGVEAWRWFAPGWFGVQVYADSPSLNVSACYTERCFVAIPEQSGKRWVYNTCVLAQYNTEDPRLQAIPGSNGGTGVIHNVTVSATNPTSRNVRNFSSMVGPVGAANIYPGWGGCQGNAEPVSYEYPFSYTGSS